MKRLAFCLAALAACTKPAPPPSDACTLGLRPTPLRLLTRFEVDNTLRDLVGDTTRPGQLLPVEPLALGLDNNGDVLSVTPDFQNRLLTIAEQVAARAVSTHRTELVSCTTSDAACGATFVSEFGRRAFRRPLTAEERDTFTELFEKGRTTEGFDAALEWTVTAFLMSPQFLYRLEPFIIPSGVEQVDAAALASRLSYFLWGTMPDEALLASAESGALVDDAELAAQTQRLLKDPRSTAPAAHFFSLWLGLDGVDGLEKDPTLYPAFNPAVRASFKQSAEMYVGDVFSTAKSLHALLTSNVLFVDQAMGGMYGAGPVPSSGFVRLEMPPDRRVGALTQPGFLARLSSPDQSSPVRRGVFVLDKVMCEVVAPPPPTVMAVPPKVDASSTTRERFDVHGKTAGCSGCHLRIDGIGFGFEHYDGIGAWRDQDNGKSVDSTGEVLEANDESLDGPYDGAAQLMERLSRSRQVHDCMASQWMRYALGRIETKADSCSLQQAQEAFFAGQGDFDALRLAVVKSPSFRNHAHVEVLP